MICDTEELSILCSLVKDTDLVDALNDDTSKWTIFAPTNDSFENIGYDIMDKITKNTKVLRNILLFHAVDDKVKSDDLYCTGLAEMANGDDSRTVCTANGSIHQKGGGNPSNKMPRIVHVDIPTCQGYIHIVNQVMLPRRLHKEADIPDVPQKMPEPPMPECQTIGTYYNIVFAYSFMFFGSFFRNASSPTLFLLSDILILKKITAELVCGDSDLSELCRAVELANEHEALIANLVDPTKKYTVFAPTNQAFYEYTDVLEFQWDDLYDKDISHLVKFHIIKDDIKYADDLICTRAVEMMNGKDSRTVCSHGYKHQKGLMNPSDDMPKIVEDDIAACNGVIHKVDE